jgi:hypothetical protein
MRRVILLHKGYPYFTVALLQDLQTGKTNLRDRKNRPFVFELSREAQMAWGSRFSAAESTQIPHPKF